MDGLGYWRRSRPHRLASHYGELSRMVTSVEKII